MAIARVSELLKARGLPVKQEYQDIIADSLFAKRCAEKSNSSDSILVYIDASNIYWGPLTGGYILRVNADDVKRVARNKYFYKGGGCTRLVPGDAIEILYGEEDLRFAAYFDQNQGMTLMPIGDYLAGQRPSQAV